MAPVLPTVHQKASDFSRQKTGYLGNYFRLAERTRRSGHLLGVLNKCILIYVLQRETKTLQVAKISRCDGMIFGRIKAGLLYLIQLKQ